MILSIHIRDVTYTFYLEVLYMIHYHDTDKRIYGFIIQELYCGMIFY